MVFAYEILNSNLLGPVSAQDVVFEHLLLGWNSPPGRGTPVVGVCRDHLLFAVIVIWTDEAADDLCQGHSSG